MLLFFCDRSQFSSSRRHFARMDREPIFESIHTKGEILDRVDVIHRCY